nr:hypothetical protein [Tanacetum cinerariifolium]
MQTQTSNTLHNVIMEAGGKDRPLMLASGNYVKWKSRIKRHIDTKPNHELIHYYLKNPLYKFTWADKEVPIFEGSPVTRTEMYMETYKNVSQDIHDQLNAEAEAVQIILTEIDNDIYSTVDACLNACEMWKAIKRLKQGESINHQNEVNEIRAERIARTANPLALVTQQQPVHHPQNHPTHYTHNSSTRSQPAATRHRGKAIVNSHQPIYDQEPSMVAEDDETSKDKEIDKPMALISLSFKKIYKPTNNNLRTSSNTGRANQDNSPRINRGAGYENPRLGYVAEAMETVGTMVVHKSGIQCYNCKEFGHVARECQKLKRVKDAAYHREKMLSYQELEAHYMYMAQLQEVSLDVANFGPIFNSEPVQKNDDDDDLANERELLASLIEKLKCEIDDSKKRNKFLETSNKVLVEKLTELQRRNDVEYASKVEIDCAKAKGDLISYKMESVSTSTAPIVERSDKLERQIIDDKLTFVDDNEKPLPKVISTVNEDSDSEVEDVVDEHVFFMASTSLKSGSNSGYNTNSLLEQWRGLGFKPRHGGFPSGAKKEWGLSPKAKVRVLHTAQLDVTVSSNH